MLLLALFLVGIFVVILSFFIHLNALENSRYWHRRGIPGPESAPYFGNINAIHGKKLGVLQLREWTQQYGPIYGIQKGWTNILVCSDVQLLNELFMRKFEYFHGRLNNPIQGNVDTNEQVGMFNAQGHRWKRLRGIASPVFSVNNLKRILPILEDSSRQMMHFMDEAYERQQPFNIHPHFHELTMDVISRVALGQPDSRQFQPNDIEVAKRIFARISNNPVEYVAWIFPRLWWIIRNLALVTATVRDEPFLKFRNRVADAVKKRKLAKQQEETLRSNFSDEEDRKVKQQIDFIDLFLEAESDEAFEELQTAAGGNANGHGGGTFQRAQAKVLRQLTIEEITSQCVLFLLAGFDTTANTLAITCWYLAWHPQVQEKLQQEIEDVCGTEMEDNEAITYEQLAQLKYSEAVMREVLRLQPIAANVITRSCAETTTLGHLIVEKGTVIQPDLFTIHRDKSLWGEDAEEFRPERWFDESSRPMLAWLPFGAGPRICIGMRLAIMEQKLALVHLLKKYSIRKCPETEKELKIIGQGVFNPSSVTIKLERRQ